jgi:hypothetical protein
MSTGVATHGVHQHGMERGGMRAGGTVMGISVGGGEGQRKHEMCKCTRTMDVLEAPVPPTPAPDFGSPWNACTLPSKFTTLPANDRTC